MEKSSKVSGSNARSPTAGKMDRTRSSPSEPKPLGFKPYETNVLSKKSPSDDGRPTSKASVHSVSGHDCVNNSDNNMDRKSTGSRTPVGRKSASPNNHGSNTTTAASNSPSGERKTPGSSHEREKSNDSPRNNSGASPIIRSGMEILSGGGHPKDFSAYKHAAAMGAFGAANPLCCPPGLADNPAFRPPFVGASPFSHHHAAAAAALLGYPTANPAAGNPYLSYARVKTPSGGEALVPVCKDPYCTGCQYSMHNAQMMMGAGTCPSGCTQCDHQKYGLAMALSSLGSMPPPSLYNPSALGPTGRPPYTCSWIAGDTYCGKRFNGSEELLQHLRTHTNLVAGGDPATSAALLAQHTHQHPLLSPSAALHRAAGGAYPAPALSPLSARYHPYGKPTAGPLPPSLAASPYSAFNTLAPYYSPYAMYSQRIGAAVHP